MLSHYYTKQRTRIVIRFSPTAITMPKPDSIHAILQSHEAIKAQHQRKSQAHRLICHSNVDDGTDRRRGIRYVEKV